MKYQLIILLSYVYRSMSASEDYTYYKKVDKYYKFHIEATTWLKAGNICKEEGATLALPKNIDEVNILKKYFELKYLNAYPDVVVINNYVFLGFHDQFRENEYVSLTGEPLQYYYHKWEPYEPNNGMGSRENCGSLYRTGKINDAKCDFHFPFFCEKKGMVEMVPKRPQIYDPAYQCYDTLDMCYKLHINPKPWNEARAICVSEGGQLAVINKIEIEWIIKKILAEPDVFLDHNLKALIGIHKIFDNITFFTVYDNRVSQSGYSNWAISDRNAYRENCGAVGIKGFISSFSCSSPAPFICEHLKPVEEKCECPEEILPSILTYTCYPKRQTWDENL